MIMICRLGHRVAIRIRHHINYQLRQNDGRSVNKRTKNFGKFYPKLANAAMMRRNDRGG